MFHVEDKGRPSWFNTKRGRPDTECWETVQETSVWPVMSRGPRGERTGVSSKRSEWTRVVKGSHSITSSCWITVSKNHDDMALRKRLVPFYLLQSERNWGRKNHINIFVWCIHYINLPQHPLSYIQPCCEVSGINIRYILFCSEQSKLHPAQPQRVPFTSASMWLSYLEPLGGLSESHRCETIN